jgi:hypothetical protein
VLRKEKRGLSAQEPIVYQDRFKRKMQTLLLNQNRQLR